ncbi:MAG: hypothetical protein WCP22_07925 [Chlamydiota bacterium]
MIVLDPGQKPEPMRKVAPEELKDNKSHMVIASTRPKRLRDEFPARSRVKKQEEEAQPPASAPAVPADVDVSNPGWNRPKTEEKPQATEKKIAKRARKKEGEK